jgi:bifunctional non-homologous end joining protein LigD
LKKSARKSGPRSPITRISPSRSLTVPIGREWVYELKLDGFRGMLEIGNGAAHFTSKTSKLMRRFDPLAMRLARALNVHSAILERRPRMTLQRLRELLDVAGQRALLRCRRRDGVHDGVEALSVDELLPRDGITQDDAQLADVLRVRDLFVVHLLHAVDDPALYTVVAQHDLEGIVAKRRSDPYSADTEWVKVKVPGYTQMVGRWELFAGRTRHRAFGVLASQ